MFFSFQYEIKQGSLHQAGAKATWIRGIWSKDFAASTILYCRNFDFPSAA